jgi:broad specificity phosphatase PhoE
MKTTLYLIRHGATEANLKEPATLLGRKLNPPLAPLGVRQAEATRDLLAIRPLDCCFSSPMTRAIETATIISAPHAVPVVPLEGITECDLGEWEGLDWPAVRRRHPEEYQRFVANPANFGYPGGENFAAVLQRAQAAFELILADHAGAHILVVGHHVVNRTFLAGLLGLGPGQAREVSLDNCGISVVVREGGRTAITTLNAAFHLQGLAA